MLCDLHYDLLAYVYYKWKQNDMESFKYFCTKTFGNHNINGGIMNLYFMSKERMKEEYNISELELDVIKMMREVVNVINEYHLLPDNHKFIYSIEGCDYLNSIEDLVDLYDLGIRVIMPVWNNANKFGSGNNNLEQGLTQLGEQLIKKAVELGIAIDLSHTNPLTLDGIIRVLEELKQEGYKPIVIASHSNVKTLTNKPRNLTDEQLLKIKDFNGLVGIVEGYYPFIKLKNNPDEERKLSFLAHLNYLKKLFGDVDNIGIATDDLGYQPGNKYTDDEEEVFPLSSISLDIKELLINNGYTSEEVDKIMHTNFIKRFFNIDSKD